MSLGPVSRLGRTAPASEDAARRRLRAGAANVALRIQRTGEGVGSGFVAEHMAQGHNARTLERWARSSTTTRGWRLPATITSRNGGYVPPEER